MFKRVSLVKYILKADLFLMTVLYILFKLFTIYVVSNYEHNVIFRTYIIQ